MKNAFTLAEVLITLGIIGVVATMTIPTVINHHKEQETIGKVKKFYSTISQVYGLTTKANSFPEDWAVGNGYNPTTAEQTAQYLKPYLKITKDCGTSAGCLGYKKVITKLNGEKHVNYDTSTNYYKVILFDGSYVWWRGSNEDWCTGTNGGNKDVCMLIWTDINGGKEPNTLGKDIFLVYLTKEGVKPFVGDSDCKKSSTGWSCLTYIMTHGNMNYLK